MKYLKFLFVLFILSLPLFSQEQSFGFLGELGGEKMNDTLWFSISLKPEVGIGPVGIGLDLPLRFSTSGEFRVEDWNSISDIFGHLRYLRLGYEKSPFYLKVGALDRVIVGHGFIMDNYYNTIDENNRKTGILFKSDLKKFGGEFIYTNIGRPEITGIRGFVRPIKFVAEIPIISNLEIGSTYLTDLYTDTGSTKGAIGFLGFDAGLPLLSFDMLSFVLYFDYAHMNNYGSGNALGARVDFKFLMNLLNFSLKFERRNITDQFLPSYFDPFYEEQRFVKEDFVKTLHSSFNGYAGELYATALGRLQLTGRYLYFNDMKNSGVLTMILDMTKFLPDMPILVSYQRRGIESSGDLFAIDSNTIFTLSVSRKIYWKLYGTLNIEQKYEYDEETVSFDALRKYGFKLGIRL
uniref:Uncharacterized protein n=1 Tax=candidate division WOR-3 bacterium TaxID=2052148 RepID=A0A7C4UGK4_UNCW3